jgi:uncharacterized membrane protein YdjX (TVP38/TMEM64 family)
MGTRSSGGDPSRLSPGKRRALAIGFLAGGLALLASSAELHAWLIGFLPAAEGIIRARPVFGILIFVLFAAVSAMLAFISSAVIVPVGIYVWGAVVSAFLLWVGWILGGVTAYTIARYFGRPVVKALSAGRTLDRYENRLSGRTPFGLVLLFQTAVPSEVPGYLLGLIRYHFWKYLAALALAELPYALAAVYLGTEFLERRTYRLVIAGIAVALFSAWALSRLHRHAALKGPSENV